METRKKHLVSVTTCGHKNRATLKYSDTRISSVLKFMMVATETYSKYVTPD